MRQEVSVGAVDLHMCNRGEHKDALSETQIFQVRSLALLFFLAPKVVKYMPSASWVVAINTNPTVIGVFFMVTACIL